MTNNWESQVAHPKSMLGNGYISSINWKKRFSSIWIYYKVQDEMVKQRRCYI